MFRWALPSKAGPVASRSSERVPVVARNPPVVAEAVIRCCGGPRPLLRRSCIRYRGGVCSQCCKLQQAWNIRAKPHRQHQVKTTYSNDNNPLLLNRDQPSLRPANQLHPTLWPTHMFPLRPRNTSTTLLHLYPLWHLAHMSMADHPCNRSPRPWSRP